MSPGDDLLPRIGKLDAARDALMIVRIAAGVDDGDLDRFDDVDGVLVDLIAALGNLSALLLRLCERPLRANGSAVSAGALLDLIAEAQELHAARDRLSDVASLGDLSWDAQ